MASFVRCWLIRAFILTVLAAGGFGIWVAINWVSPETVRNAVVDHIRSMVGDSVEVKLDSAAVRIFGGIRVTNLTLTRVGESTPFATIPSALIYHDKQALNRGKLSIRKLELDAPQFRLTRAKDGTWNLPTFPTPPASDTATPTVVVRDATVVLTDEDLGGFPSIALKNIKLHLVNDPITILKVDGHCSMMPAGALDESGHFDPSGFVVPVSVTAKWDRHVKQASAHVEIPEMGLRPELAGVFERVHPALVRVVHGLSGRIGIKFDFSKSLGEVAAAPVIGVQLELRECRFEDAQLPKPIEQLAGTIKLQNGRVLAEKVTGKLGTASIELQLETRHLFGLPAPQYGPRIRPLTAFAQLRGKPELPTAEDPREVLESKLERLELMVRGLTLDDELVVKLAPNGELWKRQFKPQGGIDVRVSFTRPEGGWRREVDIIPNHVNITYERFQYPISEVDGWLKTVNASDGTDEFRVQVTGKLGDRRVGMTGVVAGDGPDPFISLKIVGSDLPIDERLIAALPPKFASSLGKLRAAGRGDFIVEIKQPYGVNRVENTFRIRVYDGRANYLHFPYPLTRIRGNVLVRVIATDRDRPYPVNTGEDDSDRVELRNFEAYHEGGRLWLSGESEAVPGTPDRKLTLRVQGENCPIDDAFKEGLNELKLEGIVRTLAPRGEVTFGSDVEIWDRGKQPVEVAAGAGGVQPVNAKLPAEPPFNPATDLRLAFNFKGPTVTPSFFPYEMNQLSGLLRYHRGELFLINLSARHAATEVKLDAGEIRFADGGGVWANLGGITVAPFIPDAALMKAFPAKIRNGFRELNLRGSSDLNVRHLVVKVMPTDPALARGQAPVLPALPTAPPPPPLEPSSEVLVYWNAEMKLRGASIDAGLTCDDLNGTFASEGLYKGNHLGAVSGTLWLERGTIAKQPLTAVRIPYRILQQEPDPKKPGEFLPAAIEVRNLSASLFQGTLGGQARITLADTIRYRLYLTASGIKLDELARHYKLSDGAELRGIAQGTLLLENIPDTKTGKLIPSGSGQVDVPQGRMYNLPVLLDLVKVLKGQQPDGSAFEEAHATFDLRGDRVRVSQLDLLGSAVSLGGSGELDTDGKYVQFEFYTIWSQTLKRWLVTPLGDVTSILSGSLFKIELTRENGKLTPKAIMLPVVTDPVRGIAERLRNRFGQNIPTVRAAPTRDR